MKEGGALSWEKALSGLIEVRDEQRGEHLGQALQIVCKYLITLRIETVIRRKNRYQLGSSLHICQLPLYRDPSGEIHEHHGLSLVSLELPLSLGLSPGHELLILQALLLALI